MPNYSLIADAQFQPVSFQEMLYPLQVQTEYQNQIEQKYADLAIQAAKLEKLANSSVDRDSYNTYMQYKDRVVDAAKNLAQRGLRGNDMTNMLNLYRDYGTQIQPLIDAQTRRDQLIDLRIKNSIQNPFALYDRDPGSISLQEIMANPGASFKTQDGSKIMAMSKQLAEGIANELSYFGINGSENGYIKVLKKFGATQQDIMDFVSGNPNPRNKVFQYIMDTTMQASGVDESWGPEYNRALGFARMGLSGAIGKQDAALQNDKVWDFNKQVALIDYQQQKAAELEAYKAALKGSDISGLNINPVEIVNQKELEEDSKRAVKYRNDGYLDNEGRLTLKGITKYKEEQERYKKVNKNRAYFNSGVVGALFPALAGVGNVIASAESLMPENSLYETVNRIVGKELEFTKDGKIKYNPKDISPQEKMRSWYKSPGSITDATKRTAYSWRLDSSQGKELGNILRGYYGDSDVYISDFDKKSKSYKKTNDKVDDIKNVSEVQISPYGIIAKVEDSKGKYRTIELPRGLNSAAYDNIVALQKEAENLAQDIKNNRIPQEQAQQATALYAKYLNTSYKELAKLIGTSRAKNQEIEQDE